MPYVLSPSEKSSLAAVYANVKNPAHPDFNKYYLAYDALYDIITDFTGLFPKSGVDPSAWLRLQSAKAINRGEGQFSTFIREYTKAQYAYRLGAEASNELIQAASNAIAENVIQDTLDRGYPDLVRIGDIDAFLKGSVVARTAAKNRKTK